MTAGDPRAAVMKAATLALRVAVLELLARGPQTRRAIERATDRTERQVRRVIVRLHREGQIRRIGSKGSSCWAPAGYDGAVPKRFSPTVVHNPAKPTMRTRIPHTKNGGPAAYADNPAPLAESWWTLPQNREAFRQAAAARAAAMGWDR